MGSDQASKLCWSLKSLHEVGHLQEFALLTIQPLITLMLLAMGTTTMAAGVWHRRLMVTAMTFQHHHPAVLIAATAHCLQGLMVTWKQLITVATQQITARATNQISEEDHCSSSQRSVSLTVCSPRQETTSDLPRRCPHGRDRRLQLQGPSRPIRGFHGQVAAGCRSGIPESGDAQSGSAAAQCGAGAGHDVADSPHRIRRHGGLRRQNGLGNREPGLAGAVRRPAGFSRGAGVGALLVEL
jgi:hypothetical protein